MGKKIELIPVDGKKWLWIVFKLDDDNLLSIVDRDIEDSFDIAVEKAKMTFDSNTDRKE